MNATATYTAHVTGRPGAYRAVIKRDSVVIWTSTKTFHNRDETTTVHLAARSMARMVIWMLGIPRDSRQEHLNKCAPSWRVARDAALSQWARATADQIETGASDGNRAG